MGGAALHRQGAHTHTHEWGDARGNGIGRVGGVEWLDARRTEYGGARRVKKKEQSGGKVRGVLLAKKAEGGRQAPVWFLQDLEVSGAG